MTSISEVECTYMSGVQSHSDHQPCTHHHSLLITSQKSGLQNSRSFESEKKTEARTSKNAKDQKNKNLVAITNNYIRVIRVRVIRVRVRVRLRRAQGPQIVKLDTITNTFFINYFWVFWLGILTGGFLFGVVGGCETNITGRLYSPRGLRYYKSPELGLNLSGS